MTLREIVRHWSDEFDLRTGRDVSIRSHYTDAHFYLSDKGDWVECGGDHWGTLSQLFDLTVSCMGLEDGKLTIYVYD